MQNLNKTYVSKQTIFDLITTNYIIEPHFQDYFLSNILQLDVQYDQSLYNTFSGTFPSSRNTQ